MSIIQSIQINVIEGGLCNGFVFNPDYNNYSNPKGDPLDQLCDFLISKGFVDEIHYTKGFSLVAETPKALEGKR